MATYLLPVVRDTNVQVEDRFIYTQTATSHLYPVYSRHLVVELDVLQRRKFIRAFEAVESIDRAFPLLE